MKKKKSAKTTQGSVTSIAGDLIVLVADKDTKESIQCLLEKRTASLGIREIKYEIVVHPERDPGCLTNADAILRPYLRRYLYALVVFDREGCGRDQEPRDSLERVVEDDLSKNGWNHSAAVAIDPELENWVWNPSPHVAYELGWEDDELTLVEWLVLNGWIATTDQSKPERPKEAMESVLKKAKKPRSSAIYRSIAGKVSFVQCVDPAFQKFLATIRNWFPAR